MSLTPQEVYNKISLGNNIVKAFLSQIDKAIENSNTLEVVVIVPNEDMFLPDDGVVEVLRSNYYQFGWILDYKKLTARSKGGGEFSLVPHYRSVKIN